MLFPPASGEMRQETIENHQMIFLDSHVVFLMFNVGEYGQFNDQMNNSGQSFQMDAL
jgi:hypothetical protein